ncbi:MAG: hypothetical protein EXR08_00525 [Alphaproteobacteria bacterium]|nr:hypothetical protein [Alphaproteobacteria bacterium]
MPANDDLSIIAEPTASVASSIIVAAIDAKASTTALMANINSVANANTEITALDGMLQFVSTALATMGSSSTRLESHSGFEKKLQDALTIGIGFLVDADLTAESARLKSVLIQQQLSTQSLQIANSRPQIILSLFQNS